MMSGTLLAGLVRWASPMLRSFTDFVCGNESLAFESDFSLHESMRRLAAEMKPPLFDLRPVISLRTSVVVGKVAEEQVSLWCETMLMHNAFRPMFLGRFQTFDRRVILIGKMVGRDGMDHLAVGALLVIGLISTVGTVLELMKGSDNPALWLMPFAGVLPFVFVLGGVRLGRWLSSGDEDWILAAIRSALLKSAQTSDARPERL